MMDMMLAAHAVLQQAHHIYSLQSARGKTASHLLYMYRYSISSLHSLHHHSPLIYTVIYMFCHSVFAILYTQSVICLVSLYIPLSVFKSFAISCSTICSIRACTRAGCWS